MKTKSAIPITLLLVAAATIAAFGMFRLTQPVQAHVRNTIGCTALGCT